jgi:hypothetical protein
LCLEFPTRFDVDVLQEKDQILSCGRLRDVLMVIPEVEALILELRMPVDIYHLSWVSPTEH